MHTHDDLVYLAGIIDGEGTISYNNIRYPSVRIIITNNSMELMEWLAAKFGGHIATRDRELYGRSYYWALYDKPSVRELLELVKPHLIIKRNHAEIAIELVNQPRGSPMKHVLAEIIKYLNSGDKEKSTEKAKTLVTEAAKNVLRNGKTW